MIRISILGFYGYKNAGDEAILSAMISALKTEIKDVDIVIFSIDPLYTTKIHNVRAVRQLYFGFLPLVSAVFKGMFFQIIKEIKSSNLLIIGGGGLLSDWQSSFVIFQWLWQAVVAKIFKKKVMIYAVGAGPIETKMGKFMTRCILNNCTNVITVRDNESKIWLQKAGVKREIHVTADPAVLLRPVVSNRTIEILKGEKVDTNNYLIGISIWPMFLNMKYWPNQQTKFKKFKKLWPELINFVISKLNVGVVFIPMFLPRDKDFSLDLIKDVKNQDRVKVINGSYNPQELMGIMGQMDMIIGMRCHTLILAAAMGVPLVGIVYQHKSDSFLRKINQIRFSVDIGDGISWEDKDINLEEITKNIESVWLKRQELKREIITKTKDLKSKALLNAKMARLLLENKYFE